MRNLSWARGPVSEFAWPSYVLTRLETFALDTRFYLASAPADARPQPDEAETVDARWYAPAAALDAHRRGELLLVFPTIKHLEQFSAFPTADALVAHAAAHEVVPVQPRIVLSGETARILLPGDEGYDAADNGGDAPR